MAAPDERDDDSVLVTELIEGGSEVAGASVGAAVGLFGGPVGVVVGAAGGAVIARVFTRVGADIRRRMLGPREEVRIGAVVAFSGERIKQHLDAGWMPRDDGFFDARGTERPPADEVLEGVMLKARDAYEEKKLRLFGNLYANVAFDPSVSPSSANHLVELAGQLTYRQLVFLAIAAEQERVGAMLREKDLHQKDIDVERITRDFNAIALLTEMYDLYQRGLLSHKTVLWMDLTLGAPGNLRPHGSGLLLFSLMELAAIDRSEWAEFFEAFPMVKTPDQSS